MSDLQHTDVAVLLATYNGVQYVERQITSLSENRTPFKLHWLDDHSIDRTREVVRAAARSANIEIQEHHQSRHQGVPGAFFQLLECVEADIYLFCDQDDIWQPGKIDAIAANLLPDLELPVICFSDPLFFKDDNPDICYPGLEILGTRIEVAMEESRIFMSEVGYGHTEGFTRPLRDLFVIHREVARSHAFMHDMWMYDIAVAAGTARILCDAPTTLYRWHGSNSSSDFGGWRGKGVGHISTTQRQHQRLRRSIARHAEGFILASPTLPQSPKLERLLAFARLVATIDRRQSPISLLRLIRRRVTWASWRLAVGLAVACLCSDATTHSDAKPRSVSAQRSA